MKTTKKQLIHIKKVSLCIKPGNLKSISSFLVQFYNWLQKRHIQVQFHQDDFERISKLFPSKNNLSFLHGSHFFQSSDLIITLGGDGTLLGVLRHLNHKSPPVFSINLGTLGFITEFTREEFYEELEKIIYSKKIDYAFIRPYVCTIYQNKKIIAKKTFINDVVFSKSDISRMFSLETKIDQNYCYTLSGDGLIISSPIGSTAYGLAAGGPIIHPSVAATLLVPICPHSLTYRPIVIHDKSEISVTLKGNSFNILLTTDGQEKLDFDQSMIAIIKRSSKAIRLIKNTQRTYFHILREKFGHGTRDRR